MSFQPLKTGRRFFLLVLSVLVAAPYRALAKRLVKGPLVYLTWRSDPTSTLVVNWMDGDARSNDYVMYRRLAAPPESGWLLARGFKHLFADQKKRIMHHVELRGLEPDTEYIFMIRSQAPTRAGRYFKFRTLPRVLPSNFRFVTGGDMMHSRKKLDAMNQRAAQLNPWFALLGGDLAYADANKNNVAKWDDWLESWMLNSVRKSDGCLIPMVVAIGNHEVAGERQAHTTADRLASHPYDDGLVERNERCQPTTQSAKAAMHRPRITGRFQHAQIPPGTEGGTLAREKD